MESEPRHYQEGVNMFASGLAVDSAIKEDPAESLTGSDINRAGSQINSFREA